MRSTEATLYRERRKTLRGHTRKSLALACATTGVLRLVGEHGQVFEGPKRNQFYVRYGNDQVEICASFHDAFRVAGVKFIW